MKTLTHGVLPLAALAVLIGGVTFVAQYNRRPPPAVPLQRPVGMPLSFSVIRDDPDPAEVRELESALDGHLDVGLRNHSQHPVHLRLMSRSPSCRRLEVFAGSAADWHRFQAELAACSLGSTVAPGACPLLPAVGWFGRLQRTPLAVGDEVAKVPAHGAGWLRLHWRAEDEGPERLGAALELRLADGTRTIHRLEVPVVFVPGIQFDPNPVDLGDVLAGGPPARIVFWAWSYTVPDLSLRPTGDDPRYHVVVTKLDADGCRQLAQRVEAAEPRGRIRAGFQVAVTVGDRDGRLLDLGPLRQRLWLERSDGREPVSVPVTGWVRGEVTAGTPEDRGCLDLGSFAASRGVSGSIPLRGERSGLRVALEQATPDYLEASLVDEASSATTPRWRLYVRIGPDRVLGPLPADSAIVLRVEDGGKRRLIIPVRGRAFR
ncbi:MAG: hypothetical protein NZ700_00115 [Gemmataceae bacterium]|nr:hypothetical protein [Gemmataceae bacterium]MDW8265116.1 hypothetical protein [Gemmataceae bacterium]